MSSVNDYLSNPFCVRKIKEASESHQVSALVLEKIIRIAFLASRDNLHTNISQQKIADRSGISRRTVVTGIKALVSVDLITSTRRYVEKVGGLIRRTTNKMYFKALSDWNTWRESSKRAAKNAVNIIKCERESLSNAISATIAQQGTLSKEQPALRASTALNIDYSTGELLNFPSME